MILVVRHVVAEQVLGFEARAEKVSVVQCGVFNSRTVQDTRHVGFPDAFSQPHSPRTCAEMCLTKLGHTVNLRDTVTLGNGANQGFIITASHDLDTSFVDEGGQTFDKTGFMFLKPIE